MLPQAMIFRALPPGGQHGARSLGSFNPRMRRVAPAPTPASCPGGQLVALASALQAASTSPTEAPCV